MYTQAVNSYYQKSHATKSSKKLFLLPLLSVPSFPSITVIQYVRTYIVHVCIYMYSRKDSDVKGERKRTKKYFIYTHSLTSSYSSKSEMSS